MRNLAFTHSLFLSLGGEDERGGSKQSGAADSPQYLGGGARGPGCSHTRPQGKLAATSDTTDPPVDSCLPKELHDRA